MEDGPSPTKRPKRIERGGPAEPAGQGVRA